MSKLIDKIKKQSQTAPQRMGFRTSREEANIPAILLIAGITVNDAVTAVNKIEGADAILLFAKDLQFTAKNLQEIAKPVKDTPWGVFIEDCTVKPGDIAKAGCDFVVLSPTCPVAAVPQGEQIAKVLQVESSMDDGLLRSLNFLPADAVLAADTFGDDGKLLWHHLMILRNLAMLVGKPLIVPVPAAVTETELQALRDAGIEGVLVMIDPAKGEDLKALRETAAKLKPRATPKTSPLDAILPRAVGSTPEPEEEPEPDEDE